MEEINYKIGAMKKTFAAAKCVVSLFTLFIFSSALVYAGDMPLSAQEPVAAPALPSAPAPAAPETAPTESADIEVVDLRTIMDEINRLKQRIGELEEKVSEQDDTIKLQRRALDKVGEMAPEVKEVLAPPEPKILVKKFVLNGANLFTPKDFEPILRKYRDKRVGVSKLKKIAEEITTFYRSKGYITSLAYAPAQEITDNTVEFRIIEGRVGGVEVEGGKYYKKSTVARKFLVEKGQILDYAKLEKNIKRINKQPDRTVKAVLLPGEEKGTSKILVKAEEERSPHHFYLDYSNRGTKYTTRSRYGVGYINNNLLGYDDILSGKVQMGQDKDVYAGNISYSLPITRYDTRLGFYGAISHADIGGQFKVLSPEGGATAFGAYLSHPLFDKDFSDPVAFNITSTVTAGLDAIDAYNKILGEETSSDELRIVKAGISFDEKDSLGRTFMSSEVRVGIPDFLGSMEEHTVSASRIDAGGEFIKYIASLNRVMRLPWASLFMASGKFQYTDDPLVNSEQFALGGADSVRGFPENDYLSDYGWLGSLELRTPAFIFPRELKVPFDKKGASLRDAMQLVYFVDFGKGYVQAPRVGEAKNKVIVGGGLGLRFELYDHLNGRIDLGFPMGHEEPSDKAASRVHIGIQYEW